MSTIDRKIERYLSRVCENLPIKYRSRASKELNQFIRETIQESAGKDPDILAVRRVLNEIGKPEDVAFSWLSSAKEGTTDKKSNHKPDLGILELLSLDFMKPETISKIASFMMTLFTVLAIGLVVFGLLAVSTHAISTMLPVFMGCLLALAVVAGRTALQKGWLN
ncbi:MAG: hypothetical protein J6D14_03395 [Lachnospiraceae bacterium]|nr:hypothetical protein [Lachnospiraceae bacterium]